MFRRHSALFFTLLLLVCTWPVAASGPLEGAAIVQPVPELWSAEPFEQPAWMEQDNIAFGCTYNQCMRHCDEDWNTCHTVCNRDCDAGVQQVE